MTEDLDACFDDRDEDGRRVRSKERMVTFPKHNRANDFSYSEGCGCRVTFLGASNGHTSRMLPGPTCTAHTGRHQVAERDCLIERAREARDEATR